MVRELFVFLCFCRHYRPPTSTSPSQPSLPSFFIESSSPTQRCLCLIPPLLFYSFFHFLRHLCLTFNIVFIFSLSLSLSIALFLFCNFQSLQHFPSPPNSLHPFPLRQLFFMEKLQQLCCSAFQKGIFAILHGEKKKPLVNERISTVQQRVRTTARLCEIKDVKYFVEYICVYYCVCA